ncbi:MAG: acyltransferase [Lachnospiraceae bacterium]|nr:acyltransferase [Lachnospiraceae bacterium]
MENKKHYDRLDIIKGVAIFLVILGHSIQCGSGAEYNRNQLFFDDVVFKLIYSFHMPLFMIISGFLFAKTSSGKTFLMVIKSRTMRLLLPVFVWQTLLTLMSVVKNGSFDVMSYLSFCIEGFWFLWSVWWATIVCSFVENITKSKKMRVCLHSAVILLSFITPDDFNFSLHKFMYISFLIGICAAKLNLENVNFEGIRKYMILAVFVFVFVLLFIFFRRESYIYVSGWTLLGRENWISILLWDIYRVLIGLVGSGILIYMVCLLGPTEKWIILRNVGMNTSGIYILQTFANTLMMNYLASIQHHLFINIIEGIIICVVCYMGVKVISVIPYAPMILFGKKRNKRVVRSTDE